MVESRINKKKNRFKNGGKLWFSNIFGPNIDFYALLVQQAEKTLEGVEALVFWLKDGAEERCQLVRDLEHQADDMKLDLEAQLVDSFVTPFDREDIYDLSIKLDEIINAARNTVREIEVLNPSIHSTHIMQMSEIIVDGTRSIVKAFSSLKSNPRLAAEEATQARRAENRFAKVYRQALIDLFNHEDAKEILKIREIYRCLANAADRIDQVGEKLLHVIVKIL